MAAQTPLCFPLGLTRGEWSSIFPYTRYSVDQQEHALLLNRLSWLLGKPATLARFVDLFFMQLKWT